MTAETNIALLAEQYGIMPSYVDMQGHEHITSPDTQRALLSALGVEADDDAAVQKSLAAHQAEAAQRQFPEEVIVESGHAAQLGFGQGAVWSLRLDEDEAVVAKGIAGSAISLPPLQSGVYELSASIGNKTEVVRILTAPRRLASIKTLTGTSHLWGINLALYGVRSERNSGLGDFEDLSGFSEVAGKVGAAFVGINPIHNMGFSDISISPYSPSHRGFLNTSYIALDAVPGLPDSNRVRKILELHASEIAQLRASDTVSYLAHKRLHNSLLETLFKVFTDEASDADKGQFDSFAQRVGPELERLATYEALCETHGTDWREWDEAQLTSPDPNRVQFHKWLQWVADSQMCVTQQRAKAAGLSLGLYLDLAVGPRRSGAESWCEKTSIAQGVSIGAPPDHLSPEGQNWDLAAFAPRKLQQQNYQPLRRILAQTMRYAGVVRIDHVLGLNRSFLIPDNGCPGGYIRQPFESLLAIIKIEAERHNCAVIGEDLGLVPNGFREIMRDHGFYGYSVLQYEKDNDGHFHDPAKGRTQVLSSFATHDTPTLKGFETASDITWWQRLNWIGEDDANVARKNRSDEVAELNCIGGTGGDFAKSVTTILARSPAHMVSVQLDDILGVSEAQNLPGTIDEHPNWRRKYDISLEKLPNHKGLKDVSASMNRERPTSMEEALDEL